MIGGILGGFVAKLATNNEGAALLLLENAGKSAILSMVRGWPGAGVAESVVDWLDDLEEESGGAGGRGKGGRSRGAKIIGRVIRKRNQKTHQQWLHDNSWRFDWRSQPRRPAGTDAGGEWMPGRLDHPVEGVKYHLSRRERQRRTRAIKAYKARMMALGHTHTRTIKTSWGEY